MTSCSNILWWHVAATNCCVCTGEFLENLCRSNRIQSDLFYGNLLQQQNSVAETKIFTRSHEEICHCDMTPHHVATTSRPTCTQGVICCCDVLLQLVALCVPTFKTWEWRINLVIFLLNLPAQTNSHWTKATQRKT